MAEEGPGKQLVPWWGSILTGLYLAGVTVLGLWALVQMWPHPTPTTIKPPDSPNPVAATVDEKYLKARCGASADCRRCEQTAHELRTHFGRGDRDNDPECLKVFGADIVMWNERRLLLIVVLSGALGGLIASIRSYFWYVGNRQFVLSWLPLYLFTPFTSGLLGGMVYLVVRGGFFSGMSTVGDTSPYTFAAVAALVGMFHRETAEKLREVFQTVFTKAEKGKDAATNPKPALTDITPDAPLSRTGETRLSLTGTGFIAESIVRFDGKPLQSKPVRVSETELNVVVKAEDLEAHDREVVVTVFNATPGGGTSDGITLQVEPKT